MSNALPQSGLPLRKAVFLDRDGVINRDSGFVRRIEEFEFLDGVIETLQELQRRGYLLVVITNQSGIGRGYYTREDFQEVNAWMLDQLASSGISVAGVYCCPHAPDAGCECRKPAPGMILQAQREHRLDLAQCWLVGDKSSDIEAARRAGIHQTLLVRSAYDVDPACAKPLFVVDSLRDMIRLLGT